MNSPIIRRYILALLSCFIGSVLSVSSFASDVSMYDYDVKQWTAQDGLSSQSVHTVAQDRSGYIWVGSLFGLNRFDGNRFEVFNTQNTKLLVSNAISKIFTDSSGYLWIGTKSGLSGVDPFNLRFAKYTILDEVTDIVETPEKEVLVAAGGLFRIVDKNISKIKEILGEVRKMEATDSGTWIMSDRAIYLWKEGKIIKNISLATELSQTGINDLFYTENNNLLIGTEIGAFRLSEDDSFIREVEPYDRNMAIYKIMRDSRKGLWISAFGRLFYRKGDDSEKWQSIAEINLGHTPWFVDLFEDRDGNIWLASNSDGLWRASLSNINRHLTNGQNTESNTITSVVKGPGGKLWLGTPQGVGTLDKDGQFNVILSNETLARKSIFGLAFEAGKLFIATDNGLLVYENETVSIPRALEPLQWSTILVLLNKHESGMWLGTSQGLFLYRNNRLIPFVHNGKLESKYISFVLDRPDGTWIGTKRGAYRFKDNQLERIGVEAGFNRSVITGILDLGKRGVLIGSLADGLYFRSEEGEWRQYDESNGIANGSIVAMHYAIEDEMIWISTLKGIFRFKIEELDRTNGNMIIENILSPFDRQLGNHIGGCCIGVGHQNIADYGGSLWFTANKGIVEVPKNIDLYGRNQNLSVPLIQQINTGKRTIVVGKQAQFQLDLSERDFTITYSTINLKRPQADTFRYQLEGYGSDWKEVGKRREAVFTNLPSGTFKFKVQAKIVNQSWDEAKESSLTLKIPKQFSETMLYRILSGALLILTLYILVLLIRNREKRKRATLRELVEQRTVELQSVNAQLNEANQKLKQLSNKDELSGLRNRHFVYEQLPKDIEHYQRNRDSMIAQGKSFALVVINIDGFKHINDSYGPIAGDSILTQFAVLLTRETRGSDYVVRWGGDEFLIVLRDTQANQIESFIYELNLAVANGEFYLADGQNLDITSSIGYAFYPLPLIGGQLINWEVSLSLADMALHQVKNAGRNGWSTVEFDDQVDAFEFEDNDALEVSLEQLFATGAARFNVRLADRELN